MSRTIVTSPTAAARLDRARRWLADHAPAEEVLVLAPTGAAAASIRHAALGTGGAAFGWHRATPGSLAHELARPVLAARGLVPIGAIATEAIVSRAIHTVAERGELDRYAPVVSSPGLARAIARTLDELALSGVDPSALAEADPELARIGAACTAERTTARLVDRAAVLGAATDAARGAADVIPLGLPTLLLDVPLENAAEASFVAAVLARAPDVLATVPAGDDDTLARLVGALAVEPETVEPDGAKALGRMQASLFADRPPPEAAGDESVNMLSAPGESRECTEIARRILELAEEGVPFERIAVLPRAAPAYRSHLEEALRRAGVPAHFAQGVVRPDPAGRAFLALLRCAQERLSARRFAEYLSLGEVPDATVTGGPPAPAATWVAPDEAGLPASATILPDDAGTDEDTAGAPGTAVVDGTLRAPRRWERLLVDAAVIGGLERWQRRLAGLERELTLDLDDIDGDDESALAERRRRDLDDLRALRDFALPLLADLAELPDRADWSTWLERLGALASRSLRRPDRVIATLGSLAPLGPVDGVDLREVCRVLSRHLLELTRPEPAERGGRVFVAPIESARGLAFDVVFLPGLAEKLFPRKITEDPILLDDVRRRLSPALATMATDVAGERRALRLGVGAARERVVLSYPRVDPDQARPRVPSFYALEAIRASEGHLPHFGELARRAEQVGDARIGWPAPRDPDRAIDDAEYDLALLERLIESPPERAKGAGHYLLGTNPHLARALRSRGRRWLRRWTPVDGLVDPSAAARAALEGHQLRARSYSPTALQSYASCPYRFFLHAIHRLAPREVAEAIEVMDPLQRGSLVHEVQFTLLTALEADELLPVTTATVDAALARLDEVVDEVAARYHDDLAPAIERVWNDGVASIRADLRAWLRGEAERDDGFAPWRFELSFGLPGRGAHDPHPVDEPAELECGIRLRGSIDLVERGPAGMVRVTDHKTGRSVVAEEAIVDGGRSLQPVLYALAAEQILAPATVTEGRLFYCTNAAAFAVRDVPLDATARRSAQVVADTIDGALRDGFFPAMPRDRACDWCDYRAVCGPAEPWRTKRKPADRIESLVQLRTLP